MQRRPPSSTRSNRLALLIAGAAAAKIMLATTAAAAGFSSRRLALNPSRGALTAAAAATAAFAPPTSATAAARRLFSAPSLSIAAPPTRIGRTAPLPPSPWRSCESTTTSAGGRPFMATTRQSSSSSSASPKDNKPQQQKQQKQTKSKKKGAGGRTSNPTSDTGGLRRLPVVRPPNELISTARRIAKNVPADSNVKNARNRARKHGAETIQAVSKALCVPLRDCVKGYKRELRNLHPFERVVADLTARAREKRDGLTLMDVLDELNEARKELLLAGKDWTAKAKNAETAREANDYTREGEERMYQLFDELAAKPLQGILQLQKSLRTTPAVRLDTPAVVLVGAPNVGKSSIVRAISSGTPEVNNYPFTTRGMTLGHVEVFWEDEDTAAAAVIPLTDDDHREAREQSGGRKLTDFERSVEMERVVGRYAFSQLCQIMDSPGLLVRPDNERNEMESLTLAAMSHLPTAVMYVMDLSGGAGDKCSSVQDQLQLRREVRERFPRRPWIDVVSKCDLGLVEGAREELESILDGAPYLEVSVTEGTGVDELRGEVMRMLEEVRVVLDAMAAVDRRTARSDK